jgi:hypothetical protein
MTNNQTFHEIHDDAYDYLLSFDRVDDDLIKKHLEYGEVQKPQTLEQLYRGLLVAAQNRRGMPNSIGDLDELEDLLHGYSPEAVVEHYDSWDEFFRAVERDPNVSPPGPLNIENRGSYWVQFSKSVISGAEFLNQFEDIHAFREFVERFDEGGRSRLELPLRLKNDIHGFGFPLACDFLKENGYPEYVKPDTHLKKIFTELDLSPTHEDIDVFRNLIRFAETIDEVPYRVDKLFWLVGSGRFYLEEPELTIDTDRQEFIEQVTED